MQPKITIYIKNQCPYCDRAKSLLKLKNLDYEVIDITDNQELRDEMIKRSGGRKTVPQIFICNEGIGGFNDLNEMNINGKLDKLLKA